MVLWKRMDQMKKELEVELRKDGYLKKDEKVDTMRMDDGVLESVNGTKIKSSDAKRYSKIIDKYMSEIEGKFRFDEN